MRRFSVILFFFFISLNVCAAGFLLEAPPVISKVAVDEKIDTLTMGMNWEGKSVKTGRSWLFGFDQKHGKTLFKIQMIGHLPTVTVFTKKQLEKFKKSTDNGEVIWTYIFGASDNAILYQF